MFNFQTLHTVVAEKLLFKVKCSLKVFFDVLMFILLIVFCLVDIFNHLNSNSLGS